MALRAIAAGDSLACRPLVPPELGDLRQLAFDAVIERAGRRDQRRRVAGQVGEIDPVARSVLVRWPFGELTAGRWRVQVRALSLTGVATFVLDEELAVEPSMLPVRTRVILVRLALPPMRLRAQGHGAPVQAVAVLRLPPMRLRAEGHGSPVQAVAILRLPPLRLSAFGLGASRGVVALRLPPLRLTAQGLGALHIATVRLELAPMRVTAVGSGRTVGEATLRLAPLRATAVGTGLRPQATATLRLPGLRVTARGYGHIGTGVAMLRLPRMRLTATGPGGPQSTLFGWEDDDLLLGWEDDAPLEFT